MIPIKSCVDWNVLNSCPFEEEPYHTSLLNHTSTTLDERLSFVQKQFQSSYKDFKPLEDYTFPPHSLDLFYSLLTLHWHQDLPSIFAKIKRALTPQGLFIGALLGEHTLQELRSVFVYREEKLLGHVTPRFLPLPSSHTIAIMLQQAGFISPVVDREMIVQEYDSLKDLYQELRLIGGKNCLKGRFKGLTTPRFMNACEALYKSKFSNASGKVFATFEVVYLIAWQAAVDPDNVKNERDGKYL